MQKVKDGMMTRAEFIEWKDQALKNPSRPKSKSVAEKVSSDGREDENRLEEVKLELANQSDISSAN